MIGITNVGGGGTGCTLVVTGTAGHTVKMSKSGKTYTKTLDSNGKATFNGLSTGEWTITMSGGGNEATRTINITADYAITIAYFAATISVTYPAKSTCTCKNGSTTLTDTNTGTSTKTKTFTVPNTGTWTITATSTTDSSKTKSTTVSITADGQSKSVTLNYQIFAFSANNQHTEITGGWEAAADSGGYTTNIGETLSLPSCAATGKGAYIATKNMIDLTNYSKIRFNGYAESPNYAAFGVSKTLKTSMGYDGTNSYAACVRPSTSRSDNYLDVSSLTGTYYISVSAYRGTSAYAKAYAYEIELMK